MSSLEWMYEGNKALVNREDYLLGKKLDKNFTDYSDVVNEEKESGINAVTASRTVKSEPSTSKVSSLEVDIIRTEDPLIAIKVEQEKIRQKRMENPLTLLKRKKLLQQCMEKYKVSKKKTKKHDKKLEKPKERRDESPKKKRVERDRHSEFGRRDHDKSPGRKKQRHSSERDERNRADHREYRRSRNSPRRRRSPEGTYKSNHHEHSRNRRIETEKEDEEKALERKRNEMMNNAKWRNQIAESYSKLKTELEKNDAEDEDKAADFIKPMLNAVASKMSLGDRLNSKRFNLLRSYDYMSHVLKHEFNAEMRGNHTITQMFRTQK